MIELPLNLRIFEMRETHRTAYTIAFPGVAISGLDIDVDFRDGKWVLTHAMDNRVFVASHEYKDAALLMLIADRMGFDAQLSAHTEDQG
jgi:hypothetical protein